MKNYCVYDCIIGKLQIVTEEDCLLEIRFEKDIDHKKENNIDNPTINKVKRYLDKKNKNKIIDIDFNLKPQGSTYQEKVWPLLLKIPYSKTVSYKYIKEKYESLYSLKTSARAIGKAISKNPIPIIIPCHRVIGSNGSLTGYAGGLNNKIILLNHEKS